MIDFGELAGATVEGAVVGGIASTGVGAGLAGAMLAGGVGAAAGNVITQLINTGSVDAGQLALATGAGVVGGGLGYGIGKGISKISSKVAPKIANKIDDFVTKRRVARGKVSANTVTPKQCRLEMDLQFFAKESGCPFEGGGSKVDFYVRPNGEAVPGTGYRYIASDAPYLDSLKSSMKIPANSKGATYISFDYLEKANPGLLQVPHDAAYRASFDTLQIIDDLRIPGGRWNSSKKWLEPICVYYKQFGPGGSTQAITNQEILIDEIVDISL